jgi:hypothetical protein
MADDASEAVITLYLFPNIDCSRNRMALLSSTASIIGFIPFRLSNTIWLSRDLILEYFKRNWTRAIEKVKINSEWLVSGDVEGTMGAVK